MPRRHNPDQLPLFPPDSIPSKMVSYFIIISPPQNITDAVKLLEHELYNLIPGAKSDQFLKAHISLLKLNCEEADTEIIKLVKKAVEICGLARFEIELNGYDIFRHGYTSDSLVLKIRYPYPITELHKWLFNAFKPKHKPQKITPHLTIVKDIPHNKLNGINLSGFDYHHSFLCDKITILKKSSTDTIYKPLFEVPLP
ncbi:2'-5' RNA ligase [Chitinophaga sp. OAE865]